MQNRRKAARSGPRFNFRNFEQSLRNKLEKTCRILLAFLNASVYTFTCQKRFRTRREKCGRGASRENDAAPVSKITWNNECPGDGFHINKRTRLPLVIDFSPENPKVCLVRSGDGKEMISMRSLQMPFLTFVSMRVSCAKAKNTRGK